jgi:hypothetical protein
LDGAIEPPIPQSPNRVFSAFRLLRNIEVFSSEFFRFLEDGQRPPDKPEAAVFILSGINLVR